MNPDAKTEQSDESLMVQYCHGNKESFTELYLRYREKLIGFFNRRLPQKKEMALDLSQITWLKVHKSRQSYDSSKKFSNWLFSIALNSLRDLMREPKIESELRDSDEHENLSHTSELNLEIREQLEHLQKFILQLKPLTRDLILLSDYEGFSSQEIAAMFGMKDATVRQSLSRARAELREAIQQRKPSL